MNYKRLTELKAIAAKKRADRVIHINLGLTVACGARADSYLGIDAYHELRSRGYFKCCETCLELYEALSEEERLIIECP